MIVNCSRQWGKTTTVAAKVAVEALTHKGLILVIAPVERQARECFRKIHDFLRMAIPGLRWPEENKTSLELPNGARVVALPAKGENIRGFTNPRLIVIDEAAFVDDADYKAIRPMLSHGCRLIIMSTPFGKRGFFHEIWTRETAEGASGTWETFMVKAADCAHIPREFLEEERIELGPEWYRQEYECAFLDSIAGYFDMDAVRAALDEYIEPLWKLDAEGKIYHIDSNIKPLFGGK